jgi:hypothetical protein
MRSDAAPASAQRRCQHGRRRLYHGRGHRDNVIYNNGANGGGAINLDGVRTRSTATTCFYNNRGTGIVNRQGNGAGPQGMEILNNTVDQAATGRYAMPIWSAAGPTRSQQHPPPPERHPRRIN